MKTVIVLGADRVGKTTLIDNSIKQIVDANLCKYVALHYSEIKPQFNSPVEQFLRPLNSINQFETGIMICDRFSPDTLFYEKYRYQTGEYDEEFSKIVESSYMSISEELHVLLLCPNWSTVIEERHRKELVSKNPGCTEWWINRVLRLREREHTDYYDFMYDYLLERSLFPSENIHFHSTVDSIFDLLPHWSESSFT